MGFRIVQYSVQADHVHLIVEAENDAVLTNGMRSFAIRFARRVNSEILGVEGAASGATATIAAICRARPRCGTRWSTSWRTA